MTTLHQITNYAVRYDRIDSEAIALSLRASPHDMLIIQPALVNAGADTLVSSAHLNSIHIGTGNAQAPSSNKLLFGYMPVGRTEPARDAYTPLGLGQQFTENSLNWLRFWDTQVRASYFQNIENLKTLPLDGLFLDDVIAYFAAGSSGAFGVGNVNARVQQAASAMMQLVIDVNTAADQAFGRNILIIINGGLEIIHHFLMAAKSSRYPPQNKRSSRSSWLRQMG